MKGEFKKRIRRRCGGLQVLASDIMDIIRKANREKPTILKIFNAQPNQQFTDCQLLNEYYIQDSKWTKKWFGAKDPKPQRVYSDLELARMAYGIPINTPEKETHNDE